MKRFTRERTSVAFTVLFLLGCLVAAPPAQAQTDTDGVTGLIKALSSKSPVVRKQAALALGELGPKAKAALPALKAALKDADADVRAAVVAALERVENRLPLATLLKALGRCETRHQDSRRGLSRNRRTLLEGRRRQPRLQAALGDPVIGEEAAPRWKRSTAAVRRTGWPSSRRGFSTGTRPR